MRVKDLITRLLDMPLDAHVVLNTKTSGLTRSHIHKVEEDSENSKTVTLIESTRTLEEREVL